MLCYQHVTALFEFFIYLFYNLKFFFCIATVGWEVWTFNGVHRINVLVFVNVQAVRLDIY